MKLPVFSTERLMLREVLEDDIPSYAKYFVDYEVIRHLSGANVPWPYPENGVRDYVVNEIIPKQGDDNWVWGIFLLSNPDELIGIIDLWRPGRPENRGFWLGRKFWGRGIMPEALVPITNHAFDDLGFDSLVLSNAKGNIRSRRIKEKAGARLLRIEPGYYVDPNLRECEIWLLTKEVWKTHEGGVRHE